MTLGNSAFDVRDLVDGAQADNAWLQAGYDLTNRLVALYGEIPFGELFGDSWDRLIPRIRANVPAAAARGLIADPARVDSALLALEARSDLTFLAYVGGVGSDRADVTGAMQDLWQQGILFPGPQAIPEPASGPRARAAAGLISAAPGVTYRGLYETAKADVDSAVAQAVARAVDNGVVPMTPNGRCCTYDAGTGNYKCVTTPNPALICYPAANGCALGSSSCS